MKWGIASLLGLSMMTSCINNEEWDVPSLVCQNKFAAQTMSLADFVSLAPASGTITITDDVIIDGYVISSDEKGNFYKSIVFQDSPSNPTVGLQLEVNKSSNYADFPVGAHIRINAKGLVLGKDRGTIKLGSVDPTFAIGRIPDSQLANHISIVCENGKADIRTITPLVLNSFSEAKSEKYINTLVTVNNAQFSDSEVLGSEGVKTFINLSPKADTDRELADADGGTAVLRTPQYADYGGEKLPTGKGAITFVVSRYNTNYQMLIRNISDIQFTQERADVAPAKGGNALSYLVAGNVEDFNSYTATGEASETFDKYYNDPVLGNRYWRIASFRGAKYIQLGLGAGTKPAAKTYFVVPVDFDKMTSFSFKSKDGYNTDKTKSVLSVYYSKDYQPNSLTATLVPMTGLKISDVAPANGYATDFMDSGIWTKPNTLTGKGFIIFEYNGGRDRPNTTIQIDDITIN